MKSLIARLIHTTGKLLFTRLFRGRPVPSDPQRIVITMFHYIGDVFFTTGAIVALKRRFPAAAVTAVVKSRSRDVLFNNPHIDEIILFDGICNDRTREPRTDWSAVFKLATQLTHADLWLDFTGVPASCVLAALARPHWSAGFSRMGFGFLFDREIWPAPNMPLVDKDNKLAELAGAQAANAMPELHLGKSESAIHPPPQPVDVILHIGAGFPLKVWPLDRFRTLAARLRSEGLRVVVVGGPNDQAEVTNLSLLEVAAWAKTCRAYVGLDTGLTHIVASLGVPTVAIYGPTNPNYLPHWPKEHILYINLSCSAGENQQQCAACRPMFCSHHRCMKTLEVERVVQEIKECLNASSTSSQS